MPPRATPIVAALLFSMAAAAAASDPGPMMVRAGEGQALLERGRAEMIALRLDDAERTFRRLAEADPSTPAAAHHLAKIAWWRAIALEREDLYDEFFERSEVLLELLDAAGRSPWTNLFRGEVELYRATIHAKQNEHRRAALALRRAYLSFERNAREHPDFVESKWGMGLCQVVVGSVPGAYRWVLRLLGYRGTVNGGMAEIAETMEHGQYYRDEAAIFFAVIDQVINESREGGLAHLRAVHARHPDSPATLYLLGFAHLQERRAEEAERVLREADQRHRQAAVFPNPFVAYYLGHALFRQNRFEEAAEAFDRFLTTFDGEALVAQARLHRGLALEMLGKRRQAVVYYQSIGARNDHDADASARREAQRLLEGPMTSSQRSLLLGRNAYDGGRYREAISAVQGVLSDRTIPAVERAEAAYRSGRAYQAMQRWDESLRHFQFAITHPGDPLAKWGPWSQLYAAQVHEARGDRESARRGYQRALAYSEPFEYHKGLEQRARAALERL